MIKFVRLLAFGLASLTFATTSATAQTWPDKSIRMIVPAGAGGGTDVYARLFASALSTRLGQPVIVENISGANGLVGLKALKEAEPDGYTIAMSYDTPIVANPALQQNPPYDPLVDFVPLARMAKTTLVLVANPKLGVETLDQLFELAKAQPGKIAYGSAGVGNFSHLAIEQLAKIAGVKFLHVPYNSAAQVMPDLLAGDISFTLLGKQTVTEHVKEGKLVALAGAEKVAALPKMPTFAEAGFPEFEASSWGGVFAPAGTPKKITDRLTSELLAIARDPAFVEQLKAINVGADPLGPEEFRALIASDLLKWKEVVEFANIPRQ